MYFDNTLPSLISFQSHPLFSLHITLCPFLQLLTHQDYPNLYCPNNLQYVIFRRSMSTYQGPYTQRKLALLPEASRFQKLHGYGKDSLCRSNFMLGFGRSWIFTGIVHTVNSYVQPKDTIFFIIIHRLQLLKCFFHNDP